MNKLIKAVESNVEPEIIDEREYNKRKAAKKVRMIETKHKILLPPESQEIDNLTFNWKKPKTWLIRETNNFKFAWDIWCLICVIYIAIVTPYRLAFVLDDTLPYMTLGYISDVSFLIDLILTFLTEVYVEEEFITVRDHK
jgi:hypothetical protein